MRYAAFDATDPESVRVALGHFPAVVDLLVNDAGRNTDQRRPPVDTGDLCGDRGRVARPSSPGYRGLPWHRDR